MTFDTSAKICIFLLASQDLMCFLRVFPSKDHHDQRERLEDHPGHPGVRHRRERPQRWWEIPHLCATGGCSAGGFFVGFGLGDSGVLTSFSLVLERTRMERWWYVSLCLVVWKHCICSSLGMIWVMTASGEHMHLVVRCSRAEWFYSDVIWLHIGEVGCGVVTDPSWESSRKRSDPPCLVMSLMRTNWFKCSLPPSIGSCCVFSLPVWK